MTPVDRARDLGTEHGTRAAVEWWPSVNTLDLGPALDGVDRELVDWPQPDLSGLGVVTELELPVAAGDFDQLYAIRQVYEAAFTAAVEQTIQARCES